MGQNQRRNIERILKLRELYADNKIAYPFTELNYKKPVEKKAALITGGIGDFLAIEPFILQPDQKVQEIYLATRGHNEIGTLLRATYPRISLKNALPKFPHDRYCFFHRSELVDYMQKRSIKVPTNLINSLDYSISQIFPEIHSSKLRFSRSSYIENKIADIKKFNLPDRYCGIVTCTNRDSSSVKNGRNLSELEIQNIADTIKIPKVCIFCLCRNPHPNIKHLKGLSFPESIEIMKGAACYAGVDSCLSVIAGYKMAAKNIAIKSVNDHCYNNIPCYYNLIKNSNFLYRDLLHDLSNLAPS